MFASAPELSTPKSISDSGKHSPGIGMRMVDTYLLNVLVGFQVKLFSLLPPF